MTSFLVEKKNKKSFEDKVSKLSIRTRQNIKAAKNSFDRFCQDYYDGRTRRYAILEKKIVFEKNKKNSTVNVFQAT